MSGHTHSTPRAHPTRRALPSVAVLMLALALTVGSQPIVHQVNSPVVAGPPAELSGMYDEARFTLHVVIDTSGEPLANSGTILIEAELDDTPDDSASPDTADTATPNSLARLRHRLWDACGREVTELAGSDAGSFGSSFVFPMEAAEDSPGDCDRGYDWCLFEAGHCELDIELSYELVAGSAALVDWKARVELSAIASGALGGGYPDEVTVLLSVE